MGYDQPLHTTIEFIHIANAVTSSFWLYSNLSFYNGTGLQTMLSHILTIARYTLLEGLRARLVWLVLLVMAILFTASVLVQQLAITESVRMQIGFLAATLRPASVFIICLYIISSQAREFNDKGFELILSLDLARASLVLGKLLGYAAIGLMLALAISLLAATLAPLQQASIWGASLLLELWLMSALSLFCVITFSHIMPAMSFALGFYLLARSISTIQLISGSAVLDKASFVHQLMTGAIDLIAAMLPRLETFTQSAWLVNAAGNWSMLAPILLQSTLYIGLLTAAAMFDLYRKNW